ncbi:MAG: FG-GAP repeat protein [Candidatus Eisenbacteria bacterium]|nr:FG-GAP repeat protein [Candidatus Eisenbacteria bacterium]
MIVRSLVVLCVALLVALLPVVSDDAAAGTLIDLSLERVPAICGDVPEGQFGFCTAIADLDGNGFRELIVGAPGMPGTTGTDHTGGVFLFDRSAGDALQRLLLQGEARPDAQGVLGVSSDEIAVAFIGGTADRGRFGESLAVGDFDGDGIEDLAVGAPASDCAGAISCGSAAVFFGSVQRSLGRMAEIGPDVVVSGSLAGGRLGSAMASVDIDGDGSDELLIAAPGGETWAEDPGAIFVIRGSILRTAAASPDHGAAAEEMAEAIIVGQSRGDALGGIAAGDIDGDGRVDLVLGAYQADCGDPPLIDAGRVYFMPAMRVHENGATVLPAAGSGTVDGTAERGFLGRSMAVGDIDQDGVDDVLVSEYGSGAGSDRIEATGEVFILFGGLGAAGRSGAVGAPASLSDTSVPRFTARARCDMFGLPVLLSDIDGDGYADMLVASQFADGLDDDRESCGEVYVYRGSLKSVMAAKAGSAERAGITIVGERASDSIGGSLLVSDIFGGIAPELIIGAPDAAGRGIEAGEREGMLIVVPDLLLAR